MGPDEAAVYDNGIQKMREKEYPVINGEEIVALIDDGAHTMQ
jgi:copper(I)-binding protein